MERSDEITTDFLRELLSYNPETGILVWRPRSLRLFATAHEWKRWNTRYANTEAGGKNNKGYLSLKIFRKDFKAHRVVWKLMTGNWPEGEIDHIDGQTSNNAWSNLRDVPKAENQKNQKTASNNTSGTLGVTWHKQHQKWSAIIIANRRRHWLGLFDTKEGAIAARKLAEQRLGFHENHGRAA